MNKTLKLLLFLVPACFALVFLCAGCNGKNNHKTTNQTVSKSQTARNFPVIKKMNTDLLNKLIQNRNGKILIVNLWSTWSAKSMNQLLILNDIYDRYNKSLADFAVITIDPSSDIDSKVVPFLEKENINYPIYMIDSTYGKQIMNMLNPSWPGSIPVMYFYNQKGVQKIMLQGMQTQVQIEKAINDLTN